MIETITVDGAVYPVTAWSRFAEPAAVGGPYARTYIGQVVNLRLAWRVLVLELLASLPAGLRRVLPRPRPFWAPLTRPVNRT